MQKRINQFLVFLTVMAVVLTSFINPQTAYADDGTNGDGETSEPAVVEETPVVETAEEIIEQIPEDIEVVVLSEDGVEPLASVEAAQIILQDDPLWCPAGHTPGDAECTSGDLNVTDLLAAIALLPEADRTGAGTIYFTSNYSLPDATFNHNNAALSLITDLTIEGGWNGQTGGLFGLSGGTIFNGATLAILNWGGNVTLNNITVNNVTNNTGLYVGTAGDIVLNNVSATNNGFDGADLVNYGGTGNVSVNGGDFSGNDDTGLYIDSAGDIAVDSVTSNGNRNGAVILGDFGTGNVLVSNSDFNNNTWTGLQVVSAGDISLDNVEASSNFTGGAYLNALDGSGNILVEDSQFNGNGQYGLRAFAKEDITLADVTVDGGAGTYSTKNGAWLKSFHGNVSVSNSLFTNNINYGLLAVAAGTVDLVNVTATFNGGDGVKVYSIYSFACFGNDHILIDVNGGTYTDNGGYGIYAYPGELGSLTLNGSPVFSPTANGLGDTFVELLSNPCPPAPQEEHVKKTKVVQVPQDGQSDPTAQDCELFDSTTFEFESGTTIEVNCPYEGNSQATDTPESDLPAELPVGLTFADAATIGLDNEGNPVTVLEDGLIDITFKIPEELLGKRLSILYWDPTANDGQGDWIELPFDQFGGAYFPLYPDNPEDGRQLCSGFERSGDTVSVTVNFPGTFVLVAR